MFPRESFKFYSVLKLLEMHPKLLLYSRNEPMQIVINNIIVTIVCISWRAVRRLLNLIRLEKVPIFETPRMKLSMLGEMASKSINKLSLVVAGSAAE